MWRRVASAAGVAGAADGLWAGWISPTSRGLESMLVLSPASELVWLLSEARAVSIAVNCRVSWSRYAARRVSQSSICALEVLTSVSRPCWAEVRIPADEFVASLTSVARRWARPGAYVTVPIDPPAAAATSASLNPDVSTERPTAPPVPVVRERVSPMPFAGWPSIVPTTSAPAVTWLPWTPSSDAVNAAPEPLTSAVRSEAPVAVVPGADAELRRRRLGVEAGDDLVDPVPVPGPCSPRRTSRARGGSPGRARSPPRPGDHCSLAPAQ